MTRDAGTTADDAQGKARLTTDERREQLLELGLRLFSQRPAAALSIDDIAVAGGVSRGLLYHYWPSKREFHLAVVRRAAELMDRRLRAAPETPRPDRALYAVRVFLQSVAERHELIATLMQAMGEDDPEIRAVVDGVRGALAERALRSCDVDDPTPEQRAAAQGWMGFVESATLAWLEAGEPDAETMAQLILRTLHAAVLGAGDPGAS